MIVEVVYASNVEHQYQYNGQEQVCLWVAFFTQWASSVIFFATFGITVYLLCLVTVQISGSNNCLMKLGLRLKYSQYIIEGLLGFLPVILAFALAWLPYIDGDYGVAGPWCWIRFVDEKCEPIGLQNQMIFYGIYDIVGIIDIIASLIFAVVYCRLSTEFKEARRLLRQTLILMLFQFVHTLIVLFQTIMRIYTGSTHHNIYALWITYAVVSPSRQLLYPVGFLVCFYPVKSMLRRLLFKTFKNIDFKVTQAATVRESTRVSPLSHTYFIMPHEPCTESTGLQRCTAAGYGGTVQRENNY